MDDWKTRLRAAREAAKLTKSALANAVGVSNPTATDWEKSVDTGGIREITGPNLVRVCEVLEITAEWLLNGRESAPWASAESVEVVEESDPEGVRIRMTTDLRLEAGIMGHRSESMFERSASHRVERSWVESSGYRPDNLVAIKVRGESMEPRINEDDIVVINTADKKLVDGAVFAVNYEGEAMIKRMQRDLGQWWLSSDNPDKSRFPRKMCMLNDDCVIVGRAVQLVSNTI